MTTGDAPAAAKQLDSNLLKQTTEAATNSGSPRFKGGLAENKFYGHGSCFKADELQPSGTNVTKGSELGGKTPRLQLPALMRCQRPDFTCDSILVDIENDPEPSEVLSSTTGMLPTISHNGQCTGFFNLRPLASGLQSGSSGTQLLAFPEFIAAEIGAVFPGLLTGARGKTWTAHVYSFFQFLFKKSLAVNQPTEMYGMLTKTQFESLGPGQCVTQEVADILMNFVSRILGGNFKSDAQARILTGISDPWSQYLQINKAHAKTLLVLSTQHALHLQPNRVSSFDKVVNEWAGNLQLNKYQGSLWPVCAREHYTTVFITKESTAQHGCVMVCRLADSASRNPLLDPMLCQGFVEAFRILCPGKAFIEAEGLPLPQQHGPDCLFHTVLFQASQITGVPLPKNEDLCQMFAALLRFYSFLLFHRDMQDRGLPMVDLSSVFQEWMAQKEGFKDFEGNYAAENAGKSKNFPSLADANHAVKQQFLHSSDHLKPTQASRESESPIMNRKKCYPHSDRLHVPSDSDEHKSGSKAVGCLPTTKGAHKEGKPAFSSGGEFQAPFLLTNVSSFICCVPCRCQPAQATACGQGYQVIPACTVLVT